MARRIDTLMIIAALTALAWGCGGGEPATSSSGSGGTGNSSGSGGSGASSPGSVCQTGQTMCGSACVALATNPSHCGKCDNACATGTSCNNGTCSCQAGLTSCNSECVDVASDPANCGKCGTACVAPQVCSQSACAESCASGLTQCGQACVDVQVSPLHCGKCDAPCAGGQLCTSGACACETGTTCNGKCVDTATDMANCGGCGTQCAAGESCSAGKCAATSAGTGGAGAVPAGLPGVVNGGACYAVCKTVTVATDAAEPDWAYEDGYSCVLPGTTTAKASKSCTTGDVVPGSQVADGLAGVVTGEDATCYPLCTVVTTASDSDEPDWGYEFSDSCVLKDSQTAKMGLPCTTGAAIPDPSILDPRDGVVVMMDYDAKLKECVPLCTVATEPSDPTTSEDWAYEFAGSCVLPGSLTGENQPCKTGEAIPAPESVPGVVVVEGTDPAYCAPLCTITTSLADDGDGDGWSYENNASCVIPGTATAETNLSCMTEQTIPEDTTSYSGVVIFLKTDNACVKDCEGEYVCVANCTYYTSTTQEGADLDKAADDWAWENNASCIIPETMTSFNTACETLGEIPDPEPRDGIFVNGDPDENSCKWTECVPLCRHVTTASDSAYPDWGYEDNNSCVIPNSTTATKLPEGKITDTSSDSSRKACEKSRGYEFPPRPCTWPYTAPDFLKPPALDAAKKKTDTFTTSGADLIDPYGAKFVIRGINNSHGWFDACGQYMAFRALDPISKTGANTVRLGWAFKSIDPVGQEEGSCGKKDVIGTTPGLLAEILYEIVKLKMVAVVAINDTTGQTATSGEGSPLAMAQDWTTLEGYKELAKAYEPYLLVGIANEWNGSNTDYLSAYSNAIKVMRDAGINNTLVITANAWGQGCQSLLSSGADLIKADPNQNLLFDIHIYNYLDYDDCRDTTGVCGTAEIVKGCMDAVYQANLPLLVGEFGHVHSGGEAVQWQTVVSSANTNGQGYAPWLWFGDTEYPALDMNGTWTGTPTEWGTNVIAGLNATQASIFQ